MAVAAAALAMTAPGAQATANRAEYQAQVNEVCVTANREAERIFGALIRKLIKAEKRGKGDGESEVVFFSVQRKRIAVPLSHKQPGPDPITRIFRHFSRLLLLVDESELANLRQVAPAPGDDGLVNDWLSSRALQIELYREALRLDARLEKLFETGPGKIGFEGFFKKLAKIERRYEQIAEQAFAAFDTDIELGARLGASYCITDATGPTG
jgi:hypothetical protein